MVEFREVFAKLSVSVMNVQWKCVCEKNLLKKNIQKKKRLLFEDS